MLVKRLATEETYDLRSRVLRPGFPPEAAHFPEDKRSVHFGVVAAGEVLCVISAHPEDSPAFTIPNQWRIRGMATDPKRQGEGLGALALKGLLEWGAEEGVAFFWCNARERAIPFYERHGFHVEGELFDIPTVGPHKLMWIQQ